MRDLWRKRPKEFAMLAALVGPAALAALLVPFRTSFVNTAAALTMVALIVAIAIAGRRFAGFVASASSALWFDVFLTRPYMRFNIDQRPDIETTICLFIVGAIITELCARSRRNRRSALDAMEFVALIHAVADLSSTTESTSTIIDQACRSLLRILPLKACRFDPQLADPPLARIVASGDVVHAGMRWPVHDIGLPGPESEIVAQWRGRAVGRFVLTPQRGQPVSVQHRIAAVTLVEVVAARLLDERRPPTGQFPGVGAT